MLDFHRVRALLRCPRCRAALDDVPGGLGCPAAHGPALAATAGIHAVSAPKLATMAAGAGLSGFGEARFGRYVVAWAEKQRGR